MKSSRISQESPLFPSLKLG